MEVFVNENKTPLTMTVDENYRCTFAGGELRPSAVQAQALGRILVRHWRVCVRACVRGPCRVCACLMCLRACTRGLHSRKGRV